MNITKLFLNLLYPTKPYCLVCQKKLLVTENIICEECKGKITVLQEPLCEKCGKQILKTQKICQDCLTSNHKYRQARSYGRYEGVLKRLIKEFKYGKQRHLAEVLGNLMVQTLEKISWPDFDYVVPVPLHKIRQKERGFNQSYLLAKHISEKMEIPLFCGIIRTKQTKHQTLLDKKLRIKNLEGAFEVVNKKPICAKTILLIDDVYTTGATVDECSKSLLKSNAKDVYVLTCARG